VYRFKIKKIILLEGILINNNDSPTNNITRESNYSFFGFISK